MKFLLSLLSIIAIQSCSVSYQSYDSNYVTTKIPARKSHSDVKLFFENETLPDEKYIDYGIISTDYKKKQIKVLANELKIKAEKAGYDAIIEVNTDSYSVEGQTILDVIMSGDRNTNTSILPVYSLRGRAVKFTKNITYLDRLVRKEEGFLINDIGEEHLFTSFLAPDGSLDSLLTYHDKGLEMHDSFHYLYSLNHLFHEKHHWKYFKGQKNIIQRQHYRVEGWPLKTCIYLYDNRNRVKEIIIKNIEPKYKESVTFEYVKSSHLVKRKLIEKKDKDKIEEIFEYSNGTLVLSKTVNKISKSGHKTPLMKVYYKYYSNSDLDTFIK